MDIITFTVISDVTYASSSIMLQYSRHWMTICHLLVQHDSSERKAISGTIKVRHLLLTRCSLNEQFWCGPSWGKLIIHVRHLWLLINFFLLLLQAEQWMSFPSRQCTRHLLLMSWSEDLTVFLIYSCFFSFLFLGLSFLTGTLLRTTLSCWIIPLWRPAPSSQCCKCLHICWCQHHNL